MYVQVYDVDDGALSVLHLMYNELRALAAHDEEKGMRTDRRPVKDSKKRICLSNPEDVKEKKPLEDIIFKIANCVR